MADNTVNRALDWDDTIEKDGPDFILLPDGDYDFEVESFERGRHDGSAKLPACNKAIVWLRISSPEGVARIRHQLFLHTKTEGLLCDFFKGIGQRQKGEKLSMDWNKVTGATGRCRVGQREFDGKTYNEVKRFYDPDAAEAAPTQPKNFTPGQFN